MLVALWEERRVIQAQADARLAITTGEREQWQNQLTLTLSDAVLGTVIVAAQDGDISGFVYGVPDEKGAGCICDLVLDAHTYHGGLGRLLVAAIREWFVAHDLVPLVVCVPRYHAVEQAFWRSMGAQVWESGRECPVEYVWMTL